MNQWRGIKATGEATAARRRQSLRYRFQASGKGRDCRGLELNTPSISDGNCSNRPFSVGIEPRDVFVGIEGFTKQNWMCPTKGEHAASKPKDLVIPLQGQPIDRVVSFPERRRCRCPVGCAGTHPRRVASERPGPDGFVSPFGTTAFPHP